MKACLLCLLSGLVLVACFPAAVAPTPTVPGTRVSKTQLSVKPASTPAWCGSLDFDLLDEVNGQACVSPGENMTYVARYPDVAFDEGMWPTSQAEAAAAYNALSGIAGADFLLITRSLIETNSGGVTCAVVIGRPVRLKKGPRPDHCGDGALSEPSQPAAGAIPASGVSTVTPNAAPSALPATPSEARAKGNAPAAASCVKDTDCPGDLICKNSQCAQSK